MAKTRQDHIDPLVQSIGKCVAPGCGPNSIQVLFTRPAGYIKNFDPAVWICSSGHCSDYDDIPSLRKPEDDPVEWIKAHPLKMLEALPVQRCNEHEDPMAHNALYWGMGGHIWADGHQQVAKLCLPLST